MPTNKLNQKENIRDDQTDKKLYIRTIFIPRKPDFICLGTSKEFTNSDIKLT